MYDDYKYRREFVYDHYEWVIYKNDKRIDQTITQAGARRRIKQYMNGRPTPLQRMINKERWRRV